MPEHPLLTAAELAFIRDLNQQEPALKKVPAPSLLADINAQISELLAHCAPNEHVSIHAHVADQLLTFDLHINQNGNKARLQLDAPQIFDEGEVNRAWRSHLADPVALRKANAQPSALWIHQLSMNGALIEHRSSHKAPKHFKLQLPLDGQMQITVEGDYVRQTADGLLAYQLHAVGSSADEQLRQFLYQQHRTLEQQIKHA